MRCLQGNSTGKPPLDLPMSHVFACPVTSSLVAFSFTVHGDPGLNSDRDGGGSGLCNLGYILLHEALPRSDVDSREAAGRFSK